MAEKLSNERVKELVAVNGVGYAVDQLVGSAEVEDDDLATDIETAKEALIAVEKHLEDA